MFKLLGFLTNAVTVWLSLSACVTSNFPVFPEAPKMIIFISTLQIELVYQYLTRNINITLLLRYAILRMDCVLADLIKHDFSEAIHLQKVRH